LPDINEVRSYQYERYEDEDEYDTRTKTWYEVRHYKYEDKYEVRADRTSTKYEGTKVRVRVRGRRTSTRNEDEYEVREYEVRRTSL